MEAANIISPEQQPYLMERPKVLIVDDEPGILDSLSCVLQAESDLFDVLTAASAEQAMELLQSNSITLLVTDLRLPKMNGIELTVLARSMSPTTRSILMTAFGNQFVMSDALKRGCYSYIEKPFDVDRMLKEILQAMRLDDDRRNESEAKNGEAFATAILSTQMTLPHGSFTAELSLQKKQTENSESKSKNNNFRRYLGVQLGDAVKKEFFRNVNQKREIPSSEHQASTSTHRAVIPRIDVTALLQSGATHFSRAQYQQAQDCWQAAIKLDPECSEAKARLILLERVMRAKKNLL